MSFIKSIEFGVKSQLAKLLATENITLEHRPGSPTAMFDVKNRVLILPVWKDISNDLYDMLVVHEVGHALDTPTQGWMDAIKTIAKKHYKNTVKAKLAEKSVQGFLNVVEDARIDKRQKRRYPGSKRNYVVGYKELHDRDFFGLSQKKMDELGFIDRANIYFKGGFDMKIKFLPEEEAFIKRMDETETFEQVVELTDEIFAWAKNKNDDLASVTTKLIMSDAEDSEEGDELDEDIDINDFDEIEDRRKSKSGGNDEEKEADEGDEDDKGKNKPKVTKPKKSKKDDKGDEGEGDDADGDEDDKGKNKPKVTKPKKSKKDDKGDEGEGDDADGDDASSVDEGEDESEEGSEGDKDTDGDGDSDGGSKCKKNDDKGKKEGKKKQSQKGHGAGENSDKDFIPESFTDTMQTLNAEQIVDGLDANYVYVKTPKFMMDVIANDYTDVIPAMETSLRNNDVGLKARLKEDLANWKKKEKDSISFMVKEFEMRKAADTHARITVAKTGVLDTNKLFSYAYNDDVFRRMATIPEGKNHGFFMVLDWSSSMEGNIKHTMKQLFSLVMFCKRIGIPFEVYLFRSVVHGEMKSNAIHQSRENSELLFNTFRLRNVLSSRMNLAWLNRAMDILWMQDQIHSRSDPMGSTPLNQSILAIDELVNAFQKKNRVQICSTVILTDGDSNSGNGYVGSQHLQQKTGGSHYFLRDHVTGVMFKMPNSPDYGDKRTTHLYLQILKHRTNANLVGFFMINSSWHSIYGQMSPEEYQNPKNKLSWEKSGFVGVKSAGYDEYYLIDVAKAAKAAPGEAINSNMTNDEKAKAFIATSQRKQVNRMLLSTFIARISDFKKWNGPTKKVA